MRITIAVLVILTAGCSANRPNLNRLDEGKPYAYPHRPPQESELAHLDKLRLAGDDFKVREYLRVITEYR